MIMKANKQIGFIYKNEESIDKILKDGEVVFERGFLREKTSTTLPITFGGVGKDLKDYKIYGNTYQNSTSGKNLFEGLPNTSEGLTSTINDDGSITYSGTASKDWADITARNYIDIEPGTYTFSINKILTYRITIRIFFEDNTYVNKLIAPGNKFAVFTLDKKAIRYYTYISNYLTVGDEYNETLYIQLEKGDVATSYEPYAGGQPSPNPDYPQEMVSCGDLITDSQDENYGKYKIPINFRSDNLYDKNKNTQNYYLDINGNNVSNTSWDITDYIPVIPNNNYTYKGITNPGTAPYCAYYDKNKNFVSSFKSQMYTNNIVIPNNIYYIRFPLCKTTSNYNIDTFEIIRNETTNIYLDSKVIRNIDEIVLNGSENWAKSSITVVNRYYIMNVIHVHYDKDTIDLISDYFKCISPQSSDNVGIGLAKYNANGFMINFELTNTSFDTLSKFVSWLQSNNVTVDYVLATPTEESITLPNIPIVEGNNTLNIETEITPSQVYIKYKSNT